jgi:hypothetical protein
MEFNDKQSKMADDRQSAVNAVKREVNPNAYQVPGRRSDQPSEPLSQSPPSSTGIQKSTYVPPHLRNRGGEGPSEPPPGPVRSGGGGAWGSRDQSGNAPPPPSTNNRFASLKE